MSTGVPHGSAVRGVVTAATVAVLTWMLTACSGAAPMTGAAPQATPQPADLLIRVSDLPAGWRSSDPPAPTLKTTLCGVDTEPAQPVSHAETRFAMSPVGPFLEQQVRVYDGDPRATISAIRAALPSCPDYSVQQGEAGGPLATGGTHTVRMKVSPLLVQGLPADAVAWRLTPMEGTTITTDVALVPRGNALIAYSSYALRQQPDPAVLASAVRSTPGATS